MLSRGPPSPRLFRGAKDLCWGAVRFKTKGIGLLGSDRPPALSLAPSEVPTTTAGRETRSGGSSAASSSFELEAAPKRQRALGMPRTQDSATAALEETFLDPAVDTPLTKVPGRSVETLYFLAICRTFLSGGTRIRTGDTMIFS